MKSNITHSVHAVSEYTWTMQADCRTVLAGERDISAAGRVVAVQSAYGSVTRSKLPLGTQPFVDEGNSLVNLGGVTAITHGPGGKGAHTLNEEVPVHELERVALVYALSAIEFCKIVES